MNAQQNSIRRFALDRSAPSTRCRVLRQCEMCASNDLRELNEAHHGRTWLLVSLVFSADHERPELMRGFVRSSDLAHLVPGAADLATPMIRQLARRLERKLAGLGEPPVLESCERRGYRLRARLVTEAG